MNYTVEAEATVPASAQRVYALLADYHDGHPRVLPPSFTGLRVIEGGKGTGTVIDVGMRAFGRVRTVRGYVTEPQPGRILEEAYPASNIVTRFYVTPVSEEVSRVRIWSQLTSQTGVIGWIERKLVTSFLQKVYRQELQLIEGVAWRRTSRPHRQ